MQPRTLLIAIAIGIPLATSAASAPQGQRIHRCVGAQGEVVFSGLACAAGTAIGSPNANDVGNSSTAPADTCPASLEALRARIGSAVANHDPNALAGLVRWRGVGARAANARLRVLRDLVARPLLALDAIESDAGGSDPGSSLRIRTGSNETGGVREQGFAIEIDGACHWLAWPD